MPMIAFSGVVIKGMDSLRYLVIHFNRMLTYKTQIKSTNLSAKKDCPHRKPWPDKASNNCSGCIRVWFSVSLTVVWVSQPCHRPTCWSLTGCKMKPWESFLEQLDVYSVRPCSACWTCYQWKRVTKVEQVKVYLSGVQNPKSPVHDAVKKEKGRALARGKSWMG